MRAAFSIASLMAHSFAQGVFPMSLIYGVARTPAAAIRYEIQKESGFQSLRRIYLVFEREQRSGLPFRRISAPRKSTPDDPLGARIVLLATCLGRAPVVILQGRNNDELISGRRIFNQHREESRRSDCHSSGVRACPVGGA